MDRAAREPCAEQAIPDRCATCAFRPGTVASQTDLTQLTARLCVLLGKPFFCHDGIPDKAEPTTLCRGWEAAHAERYHAGYYRLLPAWKRDVLRSCLEVVGDVVGSIYQGQPLGDDAAVARLTATIDALAGDYSDDRAPAAEGEPV